LATMTACPFCFNKIDSSNLGFLCSGQGNKKCAKVVDPKRVEMTGNGAPSYKYLDPPAKGRRDSATCGECGGETRRRACSTCHTALPVDFVGTKNPMLGLVGSKGSGKTVLMTVLVQQLRSTIGRRFGADISIATDNPDGMQSIGLYMKGREKALYSEGRLPDGTFTLQQRGFATPIVLRWRARKSTMLAFLDSAGEDFNSDETTQELRYLNACEYLIVALDPFSLPGARARINLPKEAHQFEESDDNLAIYALRRVTNRLRTEHGLSGNTRRKIPVPIAIVFTKIDAFFPAMEDGNPIMATAPAGPAYNEADGLAVHERVKALIREWDADEIENHLVQNYDNYRYFGVSALGAQPDYARAQVAVGGVRPHRVDDPVLWLMSKAGTVKSVKA
jgi:hypothetical protein